MHARILRSSTGSAKQLRAIEPPPVPLPPRPAEIRRDWGIGDLFSRQDSSGKIWSGYFCFGWTAAPPALCAAAFLGGDGCGISLPSWGDERNRSSSGSQLQRR